MKVQTTKVYKHIQMAYQNGYTITSAQGSSRSGKTYNILIWLIVFALLEKRTFSICRKTLPALKRSVLRDYDDLIKTMQIKCKVNKTELLYQFENGSTVEFFSTDDEQKLRGSKRDILFVNEANEISFLEWQQLNMRTTTFSIIDYNPSFSDEHWICDINRDARTYFFITTYRDNLFLPQRIVDEIESLKTKNHSLWQIYGLGQQAQIEGLVYPKYTVIDKFPDYIKHHCVATDYGFTNDPTALVECGVYENKLYINEIEYSTGLLTQDIINCLRPYRHLQIISEIDDRLIEELKRAGFNVLKVVKNDVMVGVQKIQQMEICVTKQSVNIIKELKNYTYIQKEGKWINRPIDAWNHAMDAVRYYVLMKLYQKSGGNGATISFIEDQLRKL